MSLHLVTVHFLRTIIYTYHSRMVHVVVVVNLHQIMLLCNRLSSNIARHSLKKILVTSNSGSHNCAVINVQQDVQYRHHTTRIILHLQCESRRKYKPEERTSNQEWTKGPFGIIQYFVLDTPSCTETAKLLHRSSYTDPRRICPSLPDKKPIIIICIQL